ncbi:hypothetical protein AA313_de0203016 [Arthrobotrys entomopaga]|nr:hypothetical protein AA313_de0203016 [Arthrobotrys entomopaga]
MRSIDFATAFKIFYITVIAFSFLTDSSSILSTNLPFSTRFFSFPEFKVSCYRFLYSPVLFASSTFYDDDTAVLSIVLLFIFRSFSYSTLRFLMPGRFFVYEILIVRTKLLTV